MDHGFEWDFNIEFTKEKNGRSIGEYLTRGWWWVADHRYLIFKLLSDHEINAFRNMYYE